MTLRKKFFYYLGISDLLFCLRFNLFHSNNVCSTMKLDDQDKIEHEEPKLTPAEEKIRLNWLQIEYNIRLSALLTT
jgi:hypothetical protein